MKKFDTKIISILKGQKFQYSLSIFLFILLFGFEYLHATKGIDLTDEGMYVSTALQYSMGKSLFRDEIMTVLTAFDVLISPVFQICPDISLLHMRLLGNTLRTVSLLLLFFFVSRYAPPFLVALMCTIMFLMNNFHGILSPSYNLLSSNFLLISLSLWLFSLASVNKVARFVLSVSAGFVLILAAISYPPTALVLLVPCILLSFLFMPKNMKYRTLIRPSITFIMTFGIVMLILSLVILLTGVFHDFIEMFADVIKLADPIKKKPSVKMYELIKEYSRYAPIGLVMLGTFLFSLVVIPSRKTKAAVFGAIFSILLSLSVLYFIFTVKQDSIRHTHLVVFSFIVPLALLVILYNNLESLKANDNLNWNTVKIISIGWGFISATVYGFFSGTRLINSLYGVAPLFIVSMISLHLIMNHYANITENNGIRKYVWPAIFFIFTIAMIIKGTNFHYKYIYREADVNQLTQRFNHPKLAGIHSTPDKVMVLEELLNYLNGRVKANDYFLAYNYIPMLYFLTHTRAAYGATWARDDWPLPLREKLLSEMIKKNRIPEYCIRMLTKPWDDWKTPMIYDRKSLLDLYVSENYYLEEIIYPFEIWHHGKGPKLRMFDLKPAAYSGLFYKWTGKEVVDMQDLARNVPPLVKLQERDKGDFNFSRVAGGNRKTIRVYLAQKGKPEGEEIQFGYSLGENGFNLKLQPKQRVIFIISARLSEKPKRPAELFIQDKKEGWEKNTIYIDKTPWEEYIVSKRIREDVSSVNLGIRWQPGTENEWLEIKDVRIFVD